MAGILVLLAALLTGSLLTVVIDDPNAPWWTRRRSRCSHCHRPLTPRDLLPIVSFLLLRGRCRMCRAPIPRWHLGVELATLVLFLLAYGRGVRGAPLVVLLIAFSILLALAVTDLRFWTLPDWLVGALVLTGVARSVLVGEPSGVSALTGGILGLLVLGSLTVVTRERAMGWGDVKLAGAMGVLLGWQPLIVVLLLAFVAGGLVGGAFILLRRATLKSHIPFGPFLAAATASLLLFPEFPEKLLLAFGFAVY